MPIARNSTQFITAYQEIKHRILTGAFPANLRLREVEVAETLGLGRTPVREALKRLEDERLLTHEPRRGLVVTSLDRKSVSELYAMREILEAAAAEFAARHATEAEILNMEAILQEQEQPGADAVALNLAFHEAIYGAAHNQFLIKSLQSLTETTYLLGRSTLSTDQRAAQAVQEHRQILAAIARHDPAEAAGAARHHIRQAYLERLKMYRESGAPTPPIQQAD
ncbi:GntR family transcriptional regulator [Paracandidimonas soli]|uniref:DNA-binding GntR family transcriptional regulator n=1 Tax=Paracandidimonas soli TaxID=1917182 RepID=A0A4R3UP35_9BURK|nr:GntR family transcriptional regulator [Paracandidimonas soli]TCU92253.1 DNA-binding GntR family transcriptional regulator [Paracandidimonas soli]